MKKKPGYILFIVFAMLALCTAVVSLFVTQGLEHKRFLQALMHKQTVENFATSCLTLGQGFLTFSKDETSAVGQDAIAQKTDKSSKSSDGDSGFGRLLLERVLPIINKNQTFTIATDNKNFDAQVDMILFCENGKININSLYDVTTDKFFDEGIDKKDRKVFAQFLFNKIAELTGKKSLFQPFVEFMKERKAPLNDVTELLVVKEFADCFQGNIFYQLASQTKENIENKSASLYLTDLFTVATSQETVEPWLLSPSVCVLLGVENQEKQEKDVADKSFDTKILANFKQKVDWAKAWDTTLKSLYGISYQQIPAQFQLMLTSEFQVNIFSLLIKVTVGDIVSQMFALLKQRQLPNRDIFYDVIKVYQV